MERLKNTVAQKTNMKRKLRGKSKGKQSVSERVVLEGIDLLQVDINAIANPDLVINKDLHTKGWKD